eukprot:CAMPEP_0184385186 /NCGR_PEP_ID=MMETSP0007-20130409/8595_1 /TAXON_ID=97485 /ORGANISM="Prymnesium parvum, Strain Texoma1" /LENGTH=32 /DNA_ID= /DNA_START= /DNA_END= /DNA_ORIENTATION=
MSITYPPLHASARDAATHQTSNHWEQQKQDSA